MDVFEFNDYKECVNAWINSQPRRGHGQLRKISLYLNINSVVMSQVFRGDRDLTLEQALGVTKFMRLSELERDYFILLVQKNRALNHELKAIFEKQLESLRDSSQALKNRVKHQKLTDEEKATFYSQWYYSAVRLGISIPRLGSARSIADYLGLERSLVAQVIEFLLKHELIIGKKGGFTIGPQITHIGHDSPFVSRHHTNWRVKGLQAMESITDNDLFYTGPMVLSENCAKEIRKNLVELIEKSTKKIEVSDSEVLRCLNIDWFSVRNSPHPSFSPENPKSPSPPHREKR